MITAKERIDRGEIPHYITKRNNALFLSNKYDAYSQTHNCKILEYANGQFAGYSDDPKFDII